MRIQVIDSHTAGEPTRVILENQIEVRGETMAERRADFAAGFDGLRNGLVLEPRGSDVVVGALLTAPINPESIAGVIYFNNVGMLNMCGHGTIGVAETLHHLGRIQEGEYQIDTVAGPIKFRRNASGDVAIKNVESYRSAKDVHLVVPGVGNIVGDIAYGGNWFFIVHHDEPKIEPSQIEELTRISLAIRQTLEAQQITGADGAHIDHVELTGVSPTLGVDARNFVLCPGNAFDRSPCGTGTSAKLACLAEDGTLKPGETWVQESVTGGIFRGSVTKGVRGWLPTIEGRAHITAESTLLFQNDDPYREGLKTS